MKILTAVKRPIEIKAVQYTGKNGKDILRFLYPDIKENTKEFDETIKTLEGDMKVTVGDYIIEGINGEMYPCKEDIFEKSYNVLYTQEK